MEVIIPEPLNSLANLESKAINNFFGAAGTSKTNICLLAAVDCVRKGGKVIFIDTEGGFSVERLKQLALNVDHVLENIEIVEPKTFEEQSMVVRELKNKQADLIILDSAVALYRLEHADPKDKNGQNRNNKNMDFERLDANRELSKQMSILSNLARERNIPVIVTAHTYKNWDTGENEIVGGDAIKYWSKSIMFLERTNRMSERKATITKHRSLPEGKTVKFQIVQEGIKSSGFKLF